MSSGSSWEAEDTGSNSQMPLRRLSCWFWLRVLGCTWTSRLKLGCAHICLFVTWKYFCRLASMQQGLGQEPLDGSGVWIYTLTLTKVHIRANTTLTYWTNQKLHPPHYSHPLMHTHSNSHTHDSSHKHTHTLAPALNLPTQAWKYMCTHTDTHSHNNVYTLTHTDTHSQAHRYIHTHTERHV